jgi:membrane protein involved in colicin uptake
VCKLEAEDEEAEAQDEKADPAPDDDADEGEAQAKEADVEATEEEVREEKARDADAQHCDDIFGPGTAGRTPSRTEKTLALTQTLGAPTNSSTKNLTIASVATRALCFGRACNIHTQHTQHTTRTAP